MRIRLYFNDLGGQIMDELRINFRVRDAQKNCQKPVSRQDALP
jgi:hypothetical protein